MTRRLTGTEVKSMILSLLDDVAGGEEVEITKHGRTVAPLVPARGPGSLRAKLTGVAMTSVPDETVW